MGNKLTFLVQWACTLYGLLKMHGYHCYGNMHCCTFTIQGLQTFMGFDCVDTESGRGQYYWHASNIAHARLLCQFCRIKIAEMKRQAGHRGILNLMYNDSLIFLQTSYAHTLSTKGNTEAAEVTYLLFWSDELLHQGSQPILHFRSPSISSEGCQIPHCPSLAGFQWSSQPGCSFPVPPPQISSHLLSWILLLGVPADSGCQVDSGSISACAPD